MHTIWKGAITLGFVYVPVKMYAATEEKDIALKQLHAVCGSGIHNARTCPVCETEVEWDDIVKGYEYEKGKYVRFAKEELERLQPDAGKEIRILSFIEPDEIDPVYYQKTYYLSPGDTGAAAYRLIAEAIRASRRIAVCKVAIRAKTSLALLRLSDDCLTLDTIHYPDEVRPVQQVPNMDAGQPAGERELLLAKELIRRYAKPFAAADFLDDDRLALVDAIEKKMAGVEWEARPSASRPPVTDLLAALQASIDEARPPEPEQATEKPKRKRQTAKAKTAATAEETAS
ncbi:non-homologous end joining protein Ku [Paenibacillus cymbidii]|uniref:non-homologous end joining protein Ku n=1 Tax=Paenibacillus cymbidii TaxID=1639034 RepID=UPI001081697F|nr:Ku protein [Paenibacillus cymbidii]